MQFYLCRRTSKATTKIVDHTGLTGLPLTAISISEGNRLAYVAFSRARHLFVLGIPNPPSSQLNKSQLQLLLQAGFRIEDLNKQT